MSRFTKLNYILLFFLITVATPASGGFYIGRRYVHIRNDLENHARLRIHCWSKNDDVFQTTLDPNQETSWSFIDNYFGGTRFVCDMEFLLEGRMRSGRFLVYDNKKRFRKRECYKRCKWSVRRYGLYAYDEKDKRWDYETPWPTRNSFRSSIDLPE
ncbi:self-incompatibility protein S1-like [Corylus avellana]|uniref:self-incompatibility protein S1-like n=1 Tax=Corylus avellana TaxID=13451 RepID=UPI001E20A482|nr:self-incompatibility protein S1-like [Corylus avellana]